MKSSDDWDDVEDEEEGEYSDEESPEQEGIFKPDNHEEELPLGDRLKRLSHGAGPSRRKRRHVDLGENEKLSSVEMKTGKRATSRRVENGDGTPKDSDSSAKPSGRANKNRPQELSSSRAVGRFREVVVSKREKSRDPRFEGGGKSSKLNYDIFRKAFGFLEDYQDKEIEELKKSLKKEKNQERSARLSALLTRLQQERVERARGDRTREALRQERKKERQAVADGKKPYYLKNSDKKKMSLEQRYEGLKEEGKLGKFMEKKRKRNAAKDHRWLPAKRQDKG